MIQEALQKQNTMADHNFLSNLWSALFAPFKLLFTRIWRFFSQAIQQKHSPHSPHSPPSPTPTSPASTPRTPATTAETINPLSSAASLFTPNLHHPDSTNPIVNKDHPDHSTTNSIGSEVDNTDFDGAVYPSAQGYQQDQSTDMSRKRSGRGRGGVRSSSIHQPTTVAPVASVTPVTPAIPAANTAQGLPILTNQSDTRASGDTSFTPNHINGPKLTSFKRGSGRARNRNQTVDSKKENVAPPKDNHTPSQAPLLDSPALTRLIVPDNTDQPQKPGTRSQPAAGSASTASATNPMCDDGLVSCSGAEQLHVIADRLTLADTPSSEQPDQQTLNEATAAAEASSLPVPLVVAVPVLPQLHGPQPDLQPPSTYGLPGLIEPTTDEERAEREYHLKFMREALDMVGPFFFCYHIIYHQSLRVRGSLVCRAIWPSKPTRHQSAVSLCIGVESLPVE